MVQRTYRIGFLGLTSPSEHVLQIDALRQGLRDAGFREGTDLLIEYRWAEGKLRRLPELATELVRLRPDVIVTHSTAGTRAAKQATTTIPIVIATAGDPVRSKLVASLSRPGGNVTGLSIREAEVFVKRLEFLKQIAPWTSRIAYLRVSGIQTPQVVESQEKEENAVAGSLGLDLKRLTVRGANDLPRAFSLMASQDVHAVIVQNTSVLTRHADTIARLALQNSLPTVGAPLFVEAGGLLAYGPSVEDMYRRAATYVDKILKGTRPGELPVEQATKFELIVNLETARALGLTLPPALLARADRLIK